jgi:Trk K+ transport system NAD-binding subunit
MNLNPPSPTVQRDRFLVCGLGRLGQHCVAILKEFDVTVSAIEQSATIRWEISNLTDFLADSLVGDCRQSTVLEQARVRECRAVLIVTSDESVNIETAFAVRLLNPQARLIVRSTRQTLNQLVGNHLGNFVAFEASQLPASAFAIAALDNELRGLIHLDGLLVRAIKTQIEVGHRWCDNRQLHELNTSTRRVLSRSSANSSTKPHFYDWQPNAVVQAGDTMAYIEVEERAVDSLRQTKPTRHSQPSLKAKCKNLLQTVSVRALSKQLQAFWQSSATYQSQRVAIVVGLALLTLLIVGMLALGFQYRHANWMLLLYAAGMMLLGYDAVFGALEPTSTIPAWLRLMNLLYMLAGTASVAILYALLTERLLAARFQLQRKRPPVPEEDHVVLVGLGRVGQQVAAFLQQLKQPVVGVSVIPLDASVLPQMPLVTSELTSALTRVNLEKARGIVVVSDDEMANLEVGLLARSIHSDIGIAIRVFSPQFGDNISRLLPYAKVLSAYALSAEAFAAAALGENVLSLIRLNEQTILVTEYQIKPEDSLCGLLLAEVAYGYEVVPILHQKQGESHRFMPTEDTRLEPRDRLVVLATIANLERIENQERTLPSCQLQVVKILSKNAIFDARAIISRVSGCSIAIADQVMKQLPDVLPIPLYNHQAQRLVRELSRVQVVARVVQHPGMV